MRRGGVGDTRVLSKGSSAAFQNNVSTDISTSCAEFPLLSGLLKDTSGQLQAVKGREAGSPRTHSLPLDLLPLVRQRRETSLWQQCLASPTCLLGSHCQLILNQRARRSPEYSLFLACHFNYQVIKKESFLAGGVGVSTSDSRLRYQGGHTKLLAINFILI